MFKSLSDRLSGIFDKLRGRGSLTEAEVNDAMREIRVALLEADVALTIVKDFIEKVKERAVGHEVLKSITPGQQVVKIVHDNLIDLLGTEVSPLNLNVKPPAVILMLGLQGSGKTTTAAKIARFLQEKENKKVLLASLDIYRPAAQEQLLVLGEQNNIAVLPILPGQDVSAITKRSLNVGLAEGFDVLILDTAGRLSIDEDMMQEAALINSIAKPQEGLLVVDAMTGQDAVNIAKSFNDRIGISGIVLTRIDGDARGGAALSMRAVIGKPIKFIGVGEKADALEIYHPDRLANRILGMGDVVSLVEKAAAAIDMEEAESMAKKMFSGDSFNFDDFEKQLEQMKKMGGLSGIMNFLPGVGKIKEQLKDAKIDDSVINRQQAIIRSMTKAERRNPDLLQASRKRRIANGSGVNVSDVNRLIKQFLEMQRVMKQFKKLGKTGMLRAMGSRFM
ncbi:MAG: signal recognition particle protein [Alphaproteobacteria bacterium]|nr:signal recognition particle protein [Alphaproteobacteria bacterium]